MAGEFDELTNRIELRSRLSEVANFDDGVKNWTSVYALVGGNEVQLLFTTYRDDLNHPALRPLERALIDVDALVEQGWAMDNSVVFAPEAEDGHELHRELVYPLYVGERMYAVVYFESLDRDAYLGATGSLERAARRDNAAKIAAFFEAESANSLRKLLLPDTLLTVPIGEIASVLRIREEISDIVLGKLSADPDLMYELSPGAFEKLIARLLSDLDYRVILTPPARDGGRDILALRELATGPMLTLVECKRWARDRPVSVDVVRGVFGVMNQERATNAVVATTSNFTDDARRFAEAIKYQLSLVDYLKLSRWLQAYRNTF